MRLCAKRPGPRTQGPGYGLADLILPRPDDRREQAKKTVNACNYLIACSTYRRMTALGRTGFKLCLLCCLSLVPIEKW